MAQTPAKPLSDGEMLDYTPAAAVSGGDVVVINGRVRVAPTAIAASVKGAVTSHGVVRFPKDSSVFVENNPAFWNPSGSPVTGTASSGAASNAATPGYAYIGQVVSGGNAATGDSYVDVKLAEEGRNDGARAVAATGSVIGNAAALGFGSNWVTAADGTKGVQLPTPTLNMSQPVFVKNDDTANAVLKVYPPVNGSINALGANNAISMAAKTAAVFVYTPSGWFTTPLLPS